MKPAKDRLKDAFLYYLRYKPYDKIKVSELIKFADCNRSTFYRNYDNTLELYNELCRDVTENYLRMVPTVYEDTDILKIISDMYDRALAPENREPIMLLAGKNGSGAAAIIMRQRFAEKLRSDAERLKYLTDKTECMNTFYADFIIITSFYFLAHDRFDDATYSDIDYSFDYARDPIEYFSDVLRRFYGGTKDVHTAIFLSTLKMFTQSDSRSSSLTELLSYSGFSRTVFYRIYDSKSDYFKKLGDAINFTAVKGLLPLITSKDYHAFDVLLDQWEEYCIAVERKALLLAFRDGFAYELGANVVVHLYNAYLEYLTENTGIRPDPQAEKKISFFVSSVICCLTHYYVSLDRETFFKRMELLYSVRDEMNFDKT